MLQSLSARLIVALSLLLLLFAAIVVVTLDLAFRDLSERSRRDVLEAQVVALIAAVEPDARGQLAPAEALAEPRLATPGSGLMAMIRLRNGSLSWRSPSTVGEALDFGADAAPGQRLSRLIRTARGEPLLTLSLGVRWDSPGQPAADYVFTAAESLKPYYAQLTRFRTQLLTGFALLILVLGGVMAVAMRWWLRPLRRIEQQIAEIEAGEREQLAGEWPRELAGVSANLNALLSAERERSRRYRDTLGNLAHSLKTPLSVMRTLISSPPEAATAATLAEQVERMDGIVAQQLKRAVSQGPGMSLARTRIAPILQELREALLKVHRARGIDLAVDLPAELDYPIDRSDLFELAGNLLDNACKWCARRVRLDAHVWPDPRWRRPGMELRIEDDGPGIPDAARAFVTERGARLDERVPGQGLGLAMVRDLVASYGGTLSIDRSPLGGARVTVQLPGR